MERLEKFGEKLRKFLGREELREIGGRAVKFKNKEEEQRFFEEAREEEERLIEEEEKRKREREEEERKKRLEAEEKRRSEKDLVEGMDRYRADVMGAILEDGELRYGKVDGRFQRQRIQEASERAFNETLTPMEEIEAYAASGDERVSEREIEVEGKEVKVYDLKGLPIRFLTHAIDFKGYGDENRIGSKMAGELQKKPELWDRKKSEMKINGSDGDSDCISLTYIDTETNLGNLKTGKYFTYRYGFDHVLPDSILQVKAGDGATTRTIGEARDSFLGRYDTYMPEELARRSGESIYNEVQIRRFDEAGNPRRPDYIVTVGGRGMEVMKKHAAYFGIPIINIEMAAYERQEAERLTGEVEVMLKRRDKGEEASYDEVRDLWERIQNSGAISGEKQTNAVGYGNELRVYSALGGRGEEIEEFLRYEIERRVAEAKKVLAEDTERIREAREKGTPIWRVKKRVQSAQRFERGVGYTNDAPNKIDFKFMTEGGRVVRTVAYDGEEFDGGRGYETYGGQRVVSESREYREILPLIDKLFDELIEANDDGYFTIEEKRRREAVKARETGRGELG